MPDVDCWLVCEHCGLGVVRIDRIPTGQPGSATNERVHLVAAEPNESPCGRQLVRLENATPDPGILCAV